MAELEDQMTFSKECKWIQPDRFEYAILKTIAFIYILKCPVL